jgi:hypothetical protein
VKGLERKVVICLGFDSGYFEYFDKDANPRLCPNKLYVGVTRSLERLTLIHHFESGFLPFLQGDTDKEKERNIATYCDINPTDGGGNIFRMREKKTTSNKPNKHIVTDVIRHLKLDAMEYVLPLFESNVVRESSDMILIDTITDQSDEHCENVSDITGTAIPMYYAMKVFGHDINETSIPLDGIRDHVNILRIANTTMCKVSNSWYKYAQVKLYNWLSPYQLDECIARVQTLCDSDIIKPSGIFEHRITCPDIIPRSRENDEYPFTLVGQVDYMDENSVVEFKCVKKIETEHMLQLLLYKYINETNDRMIDNYYLYNVLDDQLYRFRCPYENLQKIVHKLVKTRFIDKDMLDTDEAFTAYLCREGVMG